MTLTRPLGYSHHIQQDRAVIAIKTLLFGNRRRQQLSMKQLFLLLRLGSSWTTTRIADITQMKDTDDVKQTTVRTQMLRLITMSE